MKTKLVQFNLAGNRLIVLAIAIVLFLLAAAIPVYAAEPVYAQGQGVEVDVNGIPIPKATNGFLQELKIFFNGSEDKDRFISDFNTEKTSYSLNVTDSVCSALSNFTSSCTVEKKGNTNIWIACFLDGSTAYAEAGSTVSTWPTINIQKNKDYISGLKEALQAAEYGDSGGVISIVIGTKKLNDKGKENSKCEFDQYDVYNFTINKTPGLSTFLVTDAADERIVLKPDTGNAGSISSYPLCDTFLFTGEAPISGKIKLTLSPSWIDKFTPEYYIGNEKYAPNGSKKNLDKLEIDIEKFYNSEKTEIEIPIRIAVADTEKTAETLYTLKLTPGNYTPVLSVQPQDVSIVRNGTYTLCVDVDLTQFQVGELSYQWQDALTSTIIENETQSTFTPKVDKTGNYYYQCVVTNTVEGVPFIKISNRAKVTVTLDEVSVPEFTREVGSFILDENSKVIEKAYRTQYAANTLLDSIGVEVVQPENGVKHTYEFWYSNTESTTNATKFSKLNKYNGLMGSGKITSFYQPAEGLSAGEYYIFCKVIAEAEDSSLGLASKYIWSRPIKITVTGSELNLEGAGSTDTPYLIKSLADLEYIRSLVNGGDWLSGISFKLAADISLPADWQPIGTNAGGTVQAFGGKLDGAGHTITVAKGGKPLFNYVSDAEIKNLNIKGEEIDGAGLIDKSFIDYGADGNYWTGVPNCVTLDNVRLLAGSKTKGSGLMDGSGSGENDITIRNCRIDENVIIGYTKDQSGIGSFVGSLNGTIDNCYSYATVCGVDRIGGLVGGKGQSMGDCIIRNSAFLGKIEASGNYVGGLIGKGYVSVSAPNTPPVSFTNCYVAADISGKDFVGGLFGAEGGYAEEGALAGLVNPWNNHMLSNSFYYGQIKGASGAQYLGGLIGYYHGVNQLTVKALTNVYYYDATGANLPTIGAIGSHVTADISHPENVLPDEEYNAWVTKLAQDAPKSTTSFTDGTVLNALNAATNNAWVQATKFPILDASKPIATSIEILGALEQTEYQIGEKLNLSGITVVANYNNGKQEAITDYEVSGFDSSTNGEQDVIISWGGFTATLKVKVLAEGNINVTLTLLGDEAHGTPTAATGTHTLKDNNLTVWVTEKTYNVNANFTVKDLLAQVLTENSLTWEENSGGNYIVSINRNGVKLGEFTNGKLSGWKYTINGIYSDKGVAEQNLKDGDVIIFHYTDDYNKDNDTGEKPDDPLPSTPSDLTWQEALQATLDYVHKTVPNPEFGTNSGEWSVLALARSGYPVEEDYYKKYYDRIAETVKKTADANGKLDQNKSTENSRLIVALSSIGKDATDVGGKNLLNAYTDMAWVKNQGNNGAIWALIAMDTKGYKTPDVRDALINEILAQEIKGGGWSLNGSAADVDITAMALLALNPYQSRAEVKSAIDKGLNWLSKQQNEYGGFSSNAGGVSLESSAQVVVALSALGIDADTDIRFVKNDKSVLDAFLTYALPTGGFRHTADDTKPNAMASDQGAYALTAYERFKNGQNSLYDMSDATDLTVYGDVVIPTEALVVGNTATATVSDQKIDEAINTIIKDADKNTITIEAKAAAENVPIVKVELAKALADKIAGHTEQINFNAYTPNGGLEIPNLVLKSIVEQATAAADKINLLVEKKDNAKAEVKEKVTAALNKFTASFSQTVDKIAEQASITEVKITINDTKVTKFDGHKLTINLPVDEKLYNAGEKYRVVIISDDNNAENSYGICRNVNGQRVVTVQTTHLSTFVVVPEKAQDKPDTPTTPGNTPGGGGAGGVATGGINVKFRLIGSTKSASSVDLSEGIKTGYHGAEYVTWITTKSYHFDSEEVTVGDVFQKALDEAGLSYVGLKTNYITSITAPKVLGGFELAEFTNGKYSGWMYTLNGKHSDKGLLEQPVKNNDVIIWHYVNDYRYEPKDWSEGTQGNSSTWNKWLDAKDVDPTASGAPMISTGAGNEPTIALMPQANIDKNTATATLNVSEVSKAIDLVKKNEEIKTITIEPIIDGKVKSVVVAMQNVALKLIEEAKLGVEVNTKNGSVAIPVEAFKSIASQSGSGDFKLTFAAKDKTDTALSAALSKAENINQTAETALANAVATEVTITSNGKAITSFDGHELTVNLPVNKNFTKDESYKVVVLSSDGTVETITGKCLRVAGELVVQVKVNHLSTFIVLDEKVQAETPKLTMNFADVTEANWFYEAVKFVYEAGLMNGESDTQFKPNGNLNRAMLVTILYRLENTPEVTESNKFTDVKAGQWYTEAVIWASEQGIANGYEDGTFKPAANVSREEMAAMLMRYAEFKGVDVAATKDISGYKDADQVASWAQQNLSWANSAGLIQGDENNNLNPKGKATRAEAATILMRLVKNVVR